MKITRVEKVGKMQNGVVSFYVNQNWIHNFHTLLENPCGKVCGECGKLLVFNRYFGFLEFLPSLWKTVNTGLHKTGYKAVTAMLRYRNKEASSKRKKAK